MSTLILAAIFVLCSSDISTTLYDHIYRPNDDHNTCFEHIFSGFISDEKGLTINWSKRFHGAIKNEILKIFMRKSDFTTTNGSFETSHWRMHGPTTNNPFLIFISNETDVNSGFSSVLKKNVFKFYSKIIVLYSDSFTFMTKELMSLRGFHMRTVIVRQ